MKTYDLVTRLREGRTNGTDLRWIPGDEHLEAADEIERLRAEIKQCSVELGEAAKLLVRYFPRVAGIYEKACGRARVAIELTPCDDEQSKP